MKVKIRLDDEKIFFYQVLFFFSSSFLFCKKQKNLRKKWKNK